MLLFCYTERIVLPKNGSTDVKGVLSIMMKKPVIGVFPLWDDEKDSIWMLPGYLRALQNAGAIPVVLPLEAEGEDARRLYELCDGLLLTGGHDMAPALYGQEKLPVCGPVCPARDKLERTFFRWAYAEDKPMLGICRGAQLVNVLLGGSLYQDLETQLPGAVRHRMEPPYSGVCHTVTLEPSGFLHALLGKDSIGVNSCHHQGICRVAPALRLEASAPDGLAEALSCPAHRFLIAVQWHPEFNYDQNSDSAALFTAFVGSCSVG